MPACRMSSSLVRITIRDRGASSAPHGAKLPEGVLFHADLPRHDFLALLNRAAFLIGNSSSGIIEAASFGTPVIDVGDRQKGRDKSQNVRNVAVQESRLGAGDSSGLAQRSPGKICTPQRVRWGWGGNSHRRRSGIP